MNILYYNNIIKVYTQLAVIEMTISLTAVVVLWRCLGAEVLTGPSELYVQSKT